MDQTIRRATVLVAALAALATGGVLPAQGASADTDPVPDIGWADSMMSAGAGKSAAGPRIFRGEAFDACEAPSLATMRAWKKSSPFKAIGVYIGGRARACRQPNLTADWVRKVNRMGWKLLPLYVGSQSPCVRAANKQKHRMSRSNPWAQGAQEGQNAIARAKALGMKGGSPVYLDMEYYNRHNKSCAATTLRFVKGWNTSVRKKGYMTGFYSSATSGVAHMESARKAGEISLPQIVWFARWKLPGNVAGEPVLASNAWHPHRRIHQYQGNVNKTYGGHTLNVDRNRVDAPVAVVG
jgi:hypothetical protein